MTGIGCLIKRREMVFGTALGAIAPLRAPGTPSDDSAAGGASARPVLRVGPNRAIRTVAEAAARAQDGDVVEIDAGLYESDVAVWSQDRIFVKAVGGRVRIRVAGRVAEDKAIWVVRGGLMTIENIEFSGARASGGNGAGIRFERGHLVARHCSFTGNEMGILTSNDNWAVLDLSFCEFGFNGTPGRHSHNLYVGRLGSFRAVGCYFHHAHIGHLLKSRAAESRVFYCRLTDEAGGTASYELEFPNGGMAYVIGNIIQQGERTENPAIVSFGAEGYAHPRNGLHLVNNTLINDRAQGGDFLAVKAGDRGIVAFNNLLVGPGRFETVAGDAYQENHRAGSTDLASARSEDFRLASDSALIGRTVDPGHVNGVDLTPRFEYMHPLQVRPTRGRLNPGAMQSVGERR